MFSRVRAERLRYRAESVFDAFPWPQAATVKQIDAVAAAYGFSAKKDLLAQLLALNQQVAANIEKGEPITAPGVPRNYPGAQKLVTEDCIKPAGV